MFTFCERAMREGIEVRYSIPELPAPADADPNRLKQVFMNILDNALKYSRAPSKIFVKAEFTALGENSAVKISIADQGCGISKEDLPHVFDKFYKANVSVRGSGIGLAVTNEIVNLHKGKLEIDSKEGRGTLVTIYLPIDSAPTKKEIDMATAGEQQVTDEDINLKGDKSDEQKTHKTSVGGQALIEGVMMLGPKGMATSVRKPDGEILTEYHKVKHMRDKSKFFNLPIIRGVVNFVESMIIGYKALMYSAEASGMEDIEEENMNKFEKWLSNKFGDKLMNFIGVLGSVLGVVLAVLLFVYFPVLFFNKVNQWSGGAITNYQGLIEGVIKIVIFVAYMAMVSRMKDIKRMFMYHGAEHKSIACYESGMELTVENAAKCTRFHPRCGTSFIFVVLIFSIIFTRLLLKSFRKLPLFACFGCF